jgi:signal-transduction protein with cAMP-binding, CBS, and nucleotidyltransferase domain
MATLTLEQCMSHPLVVVSPEQTCGEILEIASRQHIHHFPIAEGTQLVGFVCTCNLRWAPLEAKVARFASRHPVTVSPRCSVLDASWLMLLSSVGSLVVADQSGPRGIVTCEDLRAVDAEAAHVLEAARCVECGAGTHLRPGPGGRWRCIDCKERLARGDLSRPTCVLAATLPHN